MAKNEIHQYDVGTQIRATITNSATDLPEDISGATTKKFWFRKPSNTILRRSGIFLTNGSDGVMYYNFASGELDECGIWRFQGYVIISGGNYHSDEHNFKVYQNVATEE